MQDGDKVSKDYVVNNNLMYPIKLKTFVALTMDVASASPRRYFFEARTNIWCLLSHGPLSIFFSSQIFVSMPLIWCLTNVIPSCQCWHIFNQCSFEGHEFFCKTRMRKNASVFCFSSRKRLPLPAQSEEEWDCSGSEKVFMKNSFLQ